jgi:hypothetical protein
MDGWGGASMHGMAAAVASGSKIRGGGTGTGLGLSKKNSEAREWTALGSF